MAIQGLFFGAMGAVGRGGLGAVWKRGGMTSSFQRTESTRNTGKPQKPSDTRITSTHTQTKTDGQLTRFGQVAVLGAGHEALRAGQNASRGSKRKR